MAACSPLVIAHTQLSLGNREVEKDSGKNFFGSVTLCCAIAPHQAVAATLVSAFNLHEPYDDAENFAPNRFHPAIWSSFWRGLPVLCNWSGLKVFQNWRRVLQSPTVLLKDIVHENRLSLPPRGASPPLISVVIITVVRTIGTRLSSAFTCAGDRKEVFCTNFWAQRAARHMNST
jgi:hypothetical protein